MNARVTLFVLVVAAVPTTAFAQGKATMAKEVAKFVMRKFGKEAAEIGSETLTKKIEALALRHGDEAFDAIRKVGPRTLHIVENAGEHGSDAVRLLAKRGDEAVWVVANKNRLAIFVKYGDSAAESMIKHGEHVETLIAQFGQPAAEALNAVNLQNGRRLSMLYHSGLYGILDRSTEWFKIIAGHGDTAVEYLWNHQAELANDSIQSAFLNEPKPFLDGSKVLPSIETDDVAMPIEEVPTSNTNWTHVVVCGIGCLVVMLGVIRSYFYWSMRMTKVNGLPRVHTT